MLSKWCVQIPQPETNLNRVHHILSEALSTTYSVWNVNFFSRRTQSGVHHILSEVHEFFQQKKNKMEYTTYSVRCVNSLSRRIQNAVHHILSEVLEFFQQKNPISESLTKRFYEFTRWRQLRLVKYVNVVSSVKNWQKCGMAKHQYQKFGNKLEYPNFSQSSENLESLIRL